MKIMKGRGTVSHICRLEKVYRTEDYDNEGNLRAPKMLWFVVVWFLLPWWLTAVGAVSGSTPVVAEVLYPTTTDAVVSLVLSLPVMLLCSIYPLRGRYEKVSLLSLGAVYLSQVVEIVRLMSVMLRTYTWYTGDIDLVISVLCIYSAGMLWMIVTSRLLMVFGGTERRKCR
ncbi:DUF2919 domain-containing protein [Salmonella enterica]|nr:DUF2919 domain-containing protein [Salmonella enterica]